MSKNGQIYLSIEDNEFIRGDVPMTKRDVRTLSITKLELQSTDTVLDIGAGTGSISVEIALNSPKSKVYAVEKNKQALKIIKENIAKFKLDNIILVDGQAPYDLCQVPKLDKVVIGGSGGKLQEIFCWLDSNLNSGGRLVANIITLENLSLAIKLLRNSGYGDIEIIQVSISKSRFIGEMTMMEGQNPIYILSATKE